ncbi:sushi domain-containing protein 2-like [Pocillopora verrucosa]|uniref:sushi domain-containing protein 2-like n=1 Tax=Pocillopora verrucosa TaxID=203993 RepID=UPI003342DF59
MKENGSDVVQIHINGRREIEILVNSALVEFDEQFMMDFQGATVIKYNNTSKYSFIFNSGLSVTIERVEDLLQFMLLVPPEFKEHTRGLLGFWDGNQENDFLLPSGASLSHTSTHSRIHYEFGQLWATNADNSLFTYEEGKKPCVLFR